MRNPDLPSVSGLVGAVGDRVGEGELIARYVDDAALAVSQVEVAEAKAQLPTLEKTIRLERKAHEAKLEGVRAR